jgi:hypothetical protein
MPGYLSTSFFDHPPFLIKNITIKICTLSQNAYICRKLFTVKHFLASAILFLIFAAGFAQSQEVPFTLEDRDRIMRIESRMDAIEARMDALEMKISALQIKIGTVDMKSESRFDQLNSRIDSLFWMMGLLAGLMILMFSFLVWDRRTALRPAINKAARDENTCNRIVCALHDYARENDQMEQTLKYHKLM